MGITPVIRFGCDPRSAVAHQLAEDTTPYRMSCGRWGWTPPRFVIFRFLATIERQFTCVPAFGLVLW